MRQFIQATDEDLAGLQQRSHGRCLRFREDLPRGCSPSRGSIGFEGLPDGRWSLLIERGVRYEGGAEEVSAWVSAGGRTFASWEELSAWLRGPLAAAYRADEPPSPQTTGPLTNLAAVRQGLGDRRPAPLDEDALYAALRAQVRGQDQALRVIAAVAARHTARPHPRRPAVIFATGPTGVGKTRTGEVLAEALARPEDGGAAYAHLRLDMTEYAEPHRVSQLLGAPQGYVGHGEGSELVDALRENEGRLVVIFDEADHAHPRIWRALMQAMDAGRLSTAAGNGGERTLDCRRSIFLFTSNLGAPQILRELRQSGQSDPLAVDEICRRQLAARGIPPEIVGRIGRYVVYRNLDDETRAEICALAVAEVAAEFGLEVQRIDPAVVIELMTRLRSRSFGVRPARYLIDDLLGPAFSRAATAGLSGPLEVIPPFAVRPRKTPPNPTNPATEEH